MDNSFTAPALDVPLVVAVNGMVCAEAMDLIRSADTVVAAEHARFFPERLSLSRTGGTAPLSAAQALAAGLVDHIVPIVRLRHEAKLTVRGLAAERTLTPTTSSARSQPRE
ncbi:hypothetical protein [Streptomyces sp. NPDC057199]|uniref:hypothetical protein n=1 Tax=Streptomyces sp. NPDC057199 TaxID=3346047 RepID=UPI00363559C0